MPNLTLREWLFIAGLYMMGWALLALITGFIRGWRGPSNRDFIRATTTLTNWMVKTNMRKPTRIRSITIYETGQLDSNVYKDPLFSVKETPKEKTQ